jgi:hypothetical protein
MILKDISQKGTSEQTKILHELTSAWDKHLVISLLNDYYTQLYNFILSNYETQDEEIEEGIVYLDGVLIREFEYLSNDFHIYNTVIRIIADCESWDYICTLEKPIEILINTLRDSLTDDELVKLCKEHTSPLKTPNNKYPDYCLVGVLVAQNLIIKKGSKYFYKEESFLSLTELSEYIAKNDILTLTAEPIRKTLTETYLYEDKKDMPLKEKSCYYWTRAKKIEKYCDEIGVTPSKEYFDAVKLFESLHGQY